MARWGWLLGLGMWGCLQAPDVALVDPDYGQDGEITRPDQAVVVDARPREDAELKDMAPPLDAAPDAMPDQGLAPDQGGGCEPIAERCDGLDNDCDGEADEGLGLGQPCAEGLGECLRQGVVVCGAGGEAVCSAVQGAASAEVCNGRDDDCDGQIDEAIPSGGCDLPGCAQAITVCRAGVSLCEPAQGLVEDCAAPGDEDCDGAVDEGCECSVGSDRVCGLSTGACERGTQRCEGGAWGACVGAVEPAPELCNGEDDDCDGRTDEGVDGAACDAADLQGACRQGTQACVAGVLRCEGAAPQAEICDGTDNDCDGQVDEDFDVGDACVVGVGGCLRNGRRICSGPQAAACSAAPGAPRAEICNRADDDCDGRTDEGFAVGQACERGEGECTTAGINVCTADGSDVMCNAPEPGPGAVEVCDGVDNDCNGLVDDILAPPPCAVGVGACRRVGQALCEAGQTACSAQPGLPEAEICDGEDSDCDGAIDNIPDDLPCGTNLFGVCADGVFVCTQGGQACQPLSAPGPELCDGLDNDCDGSVDEGAGLTLCPDAPAHTVPACVNGRCVTPCEPGFQDLDGEPGCERGCTFEPAVGLGLFRDATSVQAARDPEGRLAYLAVAPGGAQLAIAGQAPLGLDVVGTQSGALFSTAPNTWVVAITRRAAQGAESDGIDLFRVAPQANDNVSFDTLPLATPFMGFTEVDGGGDGIVFVAGLTARLDNLLLYRVGAEALPNVALRDGFPNLDPVTALAVAPVDGRAWLWGWDSRGDTLHAALIDGQGVQQALEAPWARGDAVAGASVATPTGAIILALRASDGGVVFTRLLPIPGVIAPPVAPRLPQLEKHALVQPLESGLWLGAVDGDGCGLWPITRDLDAGARLPVPVLECVTGTFLAGAEAGSVDLLTLDRNGGISLVRAHCE